MRVKMSEKYITEREEICKKIIDILQLDSEGFFYIHELDENIDKQNQIMGLRDSIKKYFTVSNISSFKPNFICKKPYLNIIRSILRQQDYKVEYTNIVLKYDNGMMRRTTKYKIYR